MRTDTTLLAAIFGGVSAMIASAAPIVARFPLGTNEIALQDADPAFPNAVLSRMTTNPGPGAGLESHPFVSIPGVSVFGDCETPSFPIEFAESFAYTGYGPGDVIDATLADWETVFYCFVFDNVWPPITGQASPDNACGSGTDGCPMIDVYLFPFGDNDGVVVVPIRFGDGAGNWNNGWFAFEKIDVDLPGCNACIPSKPLSYDEWRYVGFGYETEPNTPIINGGGLCESDMNFDAVLDLADVQTFAQSFLGADGLADINDDGIFDLADIQRFVGSFNTGCGL